MNKKRDFKNDIYNEIRNHLKCDFIKNDPSHFCTKKELCDNLHMSLRDLTSKEHGLAKLVEEKLLNHDHAIQNGVRCDRFTISDPNTYTSKEIINSKKDHIKWQKRLIEDFAEKLIMVKPFHHVKEIPVFHPGKNEVLKISDFTRPSTTTSKTNEKAYQNLIHFCEGSSNLLAISDSLSNAQHLGILEKNILNDLEIIMLNEDCVRFISKQIRNILRPLNRVEKKVTNFHLMMKIPTYFQIMQINRMAQLKRETIKDPCIIDDEFLNRN